MPLTSSLPKRHRLFKRLKFLSQHKTLNTEISQEKFMFPFLPSFLPPAFPLPFFPLLSKSPKYQGRILSKIGDGCFQDIYSPSTVRLSMLMWLRYCDKKITHQNICLFKKWIFKIMNFATSLSRMFTSKYLRELGKHSQNLRDIIEVTGSGVWFS